MLARRWIILIAVGVTVLVSAIIITVACVLLLTPSGYATNQFTMAHYNDSTCTHAQYNWIDALSPYQQGICSANPPVGYANVVTRSSPTEIAFVWECVGGACATCGEHETLTIGGCSPTVYGGYIRITVS